MIALLQSAGARQRILQSFSAPLRGCTVTLLTYWVVLVLPLLLRTTKAGQCSVLDNTNLFILFIERHTQIAMTMLQNSSYKHRPKKPLK